jgi:hypothetical protein
MNRRDSHGAARLEFLDLADAQIRLALVRITMRIVQQMKTAGQVTDGAK